MLESCAIQTYQAITVPIAFQIRHLDQHQCYLHLRTHAHVYDTPTSAQQYVLRTIEFILQAHYIFREPLVMKRIMPSQRVAIESCI